MSDWNANIIEEFRTNEGRVGGMFEGMPLLLLHSTGRRSGTERVNPLAYLVDGERWAVFGSKGGHLAHPHWIHNLEANPNVTVEIGAETFAARARVIEGPERDRLYWAHAELHPSFHDYVKLTDRVIPVIALERV